MRANATMVYSYDNLSRELRWAFPGTKLEDVTFTHPPVDAIDAVSQIACVWGYKRRVENGAALGQTATAAAKRERMAEIAAFLPEMWEQARGGPKPVDLDALVAAMASESGKPVIDVRAFVLAKSDAVRRGLADSDRFAKHYAIALSHKRPVVKLDAATEAEIDAI